eukprot:TRINITY_DN3138_c0_g1_i1.p1 TRINITY_DN3138_c0_g1~~TRINITY_DN3138_c0_g1_i1.p1  ORF type:complete len:215 (+),score=47.83 TRINITY_DN3138_c0_g1_i1:67-711(+)
MASLENTTVLGVTKEELEQALSQTPEPKSSHIIFRLSDSLFAQTNTRFFELPPSVDVNYDSKIADFKDLLRSHLNIPADTPLHLFLFGQAEPLPDQQSLRDAGVCAFSFTITLVGLCSDPAEIQGLSIPNSKWLSVIFGFGDYSKFAVMECDATTNIGDANAFYENKMGLEAGTVLVISVTRNNTFSDHKLGELRQFKSSVVPAFAALIRKRRT